MATLRAGGDVLNDIELVVFDKDGTLIDVHRYWASMVGFRAELITGRLGLEDRHRLGLMDVMGVDVSTGKIKPEGPVGIKKRTIILETAVSYLHRMGMPGQHDLCRQVFSDVDELSMSRLDRIVVPIGDSPGLLARLKAHRVKTAIATTDITERARVGMKHLGVETCIDFIAGADLVAKSKPDPEMIFLILDALNVHPSNAVMVGDAMTDVQMGINAGIAAAIGVASGLTPANELKSLTPYVIPDISELYIHE